MAVTIRFQPVGSAPQLRQRVFKISAANRFESVVAFLSRKLKAASSSDRDAGGAGGGRGEGVFCYVNSVFAPGLDEGVGGLWRVSLGGFLFFLVLFFSSFGGFGLGFLGVGGRVKRGGFVGGRGERRGGDLESVLMR